MLASVALSAISLSAPAEAANLGVTATFQNFYAPVAKDDCPNGTAVISRLDKGKFIEFDNFSLTVSNSKGKVLGSAFNETFATEDGATQIEMPVRICGDDPEYLSATCLLYTSDAADD